MRLLKKRGRSICSLLVVFLMVLALMPAQAVSAEVVIDTAFSITGVFFNHEIEERFSGTVTVGETCPICNRGQLGWYWYGAEAKKYHGIECYFCGSSIEEECTSNATCTKEGTCTKCGTSYKADHDDIYVFQQAATCTSIGYTQRCRYCRTCGDYFDAWGNILNKKDVEIPINKDAHSWGEWTDAGDGEHHTRSCKNGCGATDMASHEWLCIGINADDGHILLCDSCSAVKNSPHEWETAWTHDDDKDTHYHTCENSICDARDSEADCSGGTAYCNKKAACEVCEKEYGEVNPDNHSGPFENVEKIEPTCTTPGREAGKKCTACGQFSEGGKEIPINKDAHDWSDWVTITEPEVGKAGEQKRTCNRDGCNATETEPIPALIGYSVSVSADGSWTKGSTDSFTVTVNRSEDDENCISHYVETLIDGEAAAVTAEAGSTVVTISPEILEKLGVGTHTVTVNFDDGTAETTLTVKEAEPKEEGQAAPAPSATPAPTPPPASPETGDSTNMQLWSILLVGSAACLVSVILSSKRSRVKKH